MALAKLTDRKEVIDEWWSELFGRYSKQWKYYHTNQHVFTLLKQWQSSQF